MANPPASSISRRRVLIGVACALLAALGFSVKAILIKLAYLDAVDAVTLLTLRMAMAAPFFLLVALWSRSQSHRTPMSQRDVLAILLLGLSGYYVSSVLDFMGLQYISASLERLILFLYPTLVVILSALVFKRAVGRRELVALALSYGGIALAFTHDIRVSQTDVTLGAALVFASALTYAIYLVGAGHTIARIGATRFTAYAMLVASAAVVMHFALTHPWSALNVSPRVLQLSFALAIFSTVLPTFLLSIAIRRIGSSHTSLVGSISPMATIYLAYLVLSEPISTVQVAGSVLVLAGVLTITMQDSSAP